MKIDEFFDEYNVEHLAAYQHLRKTGTWPEGFIPQDCDFPPTWPYLLAERMARAYVKLGMAGKISGMPEHRA